ncbi:hypothetical protein Ndes2437A_g00453 [Nannochloris sp. 'desiccata']|nr:hypothetical protein KSW81_002750 [Chlorella desiccata (nom. nud.)]
MPTFNWRGRGQEIEPSNLDLAGGGHDTSVPDASATHQAREIYENQRWMGTWQPPVAILDIPSWTDPEGNEVALTNLAASTTTAATHPITTTTSSSSSSLPTTTPTSSNLIPDSPDWEVVITPSTDTEGWQYATVFKHLQYKRPGGRASQRFGDTCRRRAWRRRTDHSGGGGGGGGGGVGTRGVAAVNLNKNNDQGAENKERNARNTASAAAAAKAREAEAKNKALRGFITMVLDLLSRRKVWTLVPWDPSALFFLYKKHQEIYQLLQTQASQRQIFAADTTPPPSMLHQKQLIKGNKGTSTNTTPLIDDSNNNNNEFQEVGTATLLQDLLCAAMHSRAAYGFAMAAGHITSVTSYIKLQTVQPLTFNAVAGASVEANNEAVAALAGIAPEDILLSHWRNYPFRPCHYVAIDRVNKCVVISIRGTLEIGDLLSDLAAHPMEIDLGGVDGWVHPGILAAASYIHCTTEAALKDAAKKCPGWPVLITGHSLGGGVAALLCMLLRDRGGAAEGLGSVYAITVGSAAVMSESLAAICEEYVISLVLGSDAIPHLSYASVEKLLVEASEASPVRRVAEGLKKKLDSVLSITSTNISSGVSARGGAVSAAAANAVNAMGLAQLLEPSSTPTDEAPVVPIIDLSSNAAIDQEQKNVELNVEEEDLGTASVDAAPSVVPVLQEEEVSVLNYGSFAGADTGLATAAMAQAQQQSDAAAAAAAAGGGIRGNSTDTYGARTSSTSQDELMPNDPELLFPPGRILWIFPADEDVSSLADATNDVIDEGIIEEAWGNAWEQGTYRVSSSGDGGIGAEAVARDERRTEKGGGGGGDDRGRGVNIDEAEAQVVASHQQQDKEQQQKQDGDTSTASQQNKKTVPVVVEADRTAFERLLLMPDSLNDHLPHRILDALQQL